MKLSDLHDAVIVTAVKTYKAEVTQDTLNLAAATLQISQAYQILKECELHEKYHQIPSGGFALPGEGPISDGGSN